MMKSLSAMTHRADLSREFFQNYYEETHAPLAMSALPCWLTGRVSARSVYWNGRVTLLPALPASPSTLPGHGSGLYFPPGPYCGPPIRHLSGTSRQNYLPR